MKTFIVVTHGDKERRHILYGAIYEARTLELLVSATLDYCLTVAEERGYKFVKPPKVN